MVPNAQRRVRMVGVTGGQRGEHEGWVLTRGVRLEQRLGTTKEALSQGSEHFGAGESLGTLASPRPTLCRLKRNAAPLT